MGAEGVNDLAGEVIPLQEGVNGHGHGSAIVGVAQINFVVLGQRLGQVPQGRAGLTLQVLRGLGHTGSIVIGIGDDLLQPQQVSAGLFGQQAGHFFGVAHRNGAVFAAEIIFTGAGIKYNQLCHCKNLVSFSWI